MATWVFVATTQKVDGKVYKPNDILDLRFTDQFWGLGESTPNRKLLKKGDQVVFYLGDPIKSFTASAVLNSDAFELNSSQKEKYGHGVKYFTVDYGVLLNDLKRWDKTVPVADVLSGLSFIKNKENWGAYFQGGTRQIPSEDFQIIVEGRKPSLVEAIKEEVDIESQAEFALEAHLEEFIDQNWTKINFGQKLVRFTTEEQDGRQFPAGKWSIDFLCKDGETGDFVVVELKRGKTSDATVGQALRYIGWVQENLAKPGEKTRAIVIASSVDDALRLAVRSVPAISVMTYRVDFHLKQATGP
jgi:hypothetical protein